MNADAAMSLDTVIVAVRNDDACILTVHDPASSNLPAVPSGTLAPGDPTLELAVRRSAAAQTGIDLGYVEQLYTFGDLERGARSPADEGRAVSVAYLALIHEEVPAPGAEWWNWYEFFPWEDHRSGTPASMTPLIRRLEDWAGSDRERRARVTVTFGVDAPWDGIRVLERYELLYEAHLVAEAFTDQGTPAPDDLGTGRAMAFDHRRIAATALGRLRGKLTYRPVAFELLPETFTLLDLQQTVEALAGVRLHKQNFRRLVEHNRLVAGTGERAPSTGGRPPELFRFRPEVLLERPRPGVGVPYG